ncbi:hypothetical protein GS4_17_01000 [Gordonia soli NBRC 108243]|uniref:Uncharacterized protein n=2 Tax=Gordonia soli TaxID=320799 RepID=M0QMR7_9ACTN|nr:hypothetical protein GS4_17_01000 [Gordonia soli NBRC 108243]
MKRTILAGVVAAAAAVGVAGAIAPGTAQAATIFSSQFSPNGWGNTFDDEKGQAGTYSTTRVSDTDGSLQFETSATTPRQASYKAVNKIPLTTAIGKTLSFEKTEGNANWQIRVTGANTGSGDGFLTLVWSAPDAAGKYSAGDSNKWWATRALPGFARGETGTLEELTKAANTEGKTAVVNHYGISSQPGTPGGKVNVDGVQFNGDTTNFAHVGGAGTGSLDGLIPR